MGAGPGQWERVGRAQPCGSAHSKDGVGAGPKTSTCGQHPCCGLG